MKSSVLYDARQHATPSQLRALKERNDRKSWVDLLAKRDTPVSCPSASARVAALPGREKKTIGEPVTSYAQAFAKAEREHPIQGRFETWFSIVSEAPSPNGYTTIDAILRATAFHFPKISKRDICASRRTKEVVLPRQIAMYVCKALTPKSLPEIGRMIGGRDHTTVLHGVRKIEWLIRKDSSVAQDVAEIINSLGCRDI